MFTNRVHYIYIYIYIYIFKNTNLWYLLNFTQQNICNQKIVLFEHDFGSQTTI